MLGLSGIRVLCTECKYSSTAHGLIILFLRRYEWPLSPDGSKADASFDITDAYLIARYSWHRDVFRALADNDAAKDRSVPLHIADRPRDLLL